MEERFDPTNFVQNIKSQILPCYYLLFDNYLGPSIGNNLIQTYIFFDNYLRSPYFTRVGEDILNIINTGTRNDRVINELLPKKRIIEHFKGLNISNLNKVSLLHDIYKDQIWCSLTNRCPEIENTYEDDAYGDDIYNGGSHDPSKPETTEFIVSGGYYNTTTKSGHAMLYYIKKTDDSRSNSYFFYVFNSGEGIKYHPYNESNDMRLGALSEILDEEQMKTKISNLIIYNHIVDNGNIDELYFRYLSSNHEFNFGDKHNLLWIKPQISGSCTFYCVNNFMQFYLFKDQDHTNVELYYQNLYNYGGVTLINEFMEKDFFYEHEKIAVNIINFTVKNKNDDLIQMIYNFNAKFNEKVKQHSSFNNTFALENVNISYENTNLEINEYDENDINSILSFINNIMLQHIGKCNSDSHITIRLIEKILIKCINNKIDKSNIDIDILHQVIRKFNPSLCQKLTSIQNKIDSNYNLVRFCLFIIFFEHNDKCLDDNNNNNVLVSYGFNYGKHFVLNYDKELIEKYKGYYNTGFTSLKIHEKLVLKDGVSYTPESFIRMVLPKKESPAKMLLSELTPTQEQEKKQYIWKILEILFFFGLHEDANTLFFQKLINVRFDTEEFIGYKSDLSILNSLKDQDIMKIFNYALFIDNLNSQQYQILNEISMETYLIYKIDDSPINPFFNYDNYLNGESNTTKLLSDEHIFNVNKLCHINIQKINIQSFVESIPHLNFYPLCYFTLLINHYFNLENPIKRTIIDILEQKNTDDLYLKGIRLLLGFDDDLFIINEMSHKLDKYFILVDEILLSISIGKLKNKIDDTKNEIIKYLNFIPDVINIAQVNDKITEIVTENEIYLNLVNLIFFAKEFFVDEYVFVKTHDKKYIGRPKNNLKPINIDVVDDKLKIYFNESGFEYVLIDGNQEQKLPEFITKFFFMFKEKILIYKCNDKYKICFINVLFENNNLWIHFDKNFYIEKNESKYVVVNKENNLIFNRWIYDLPASLILRKDDYHYLFFIELNSNQKLFSKLWTFRNRHVISSK